MNISIKTLSGREAITVQVNSSDTVATLKELIYKSEGTPVDQQVLINCGKVLEDECSFAECKDSTIYLALKSNHDMKATTGVAVKLIRSMETVKLANLTPVTEHTVIDVKEMLQEKCSISVEDQTLICSGLKLLDGYKLSDCNLTEGSELELVVPAHSTVGSSMIIVQLMSSSEKMTTVRLNKAGSVKAAKAEISSQLSILPCQQRLIYDGQELEDHCTLSDYGIFKQSVCLQLFKKTIIFVSQQNGKSINLDVNLSHPVSHVKKLIEDFENISCDHQVLVYDGQKLEENKALRDYNIADFCELKLIFCEKVKLDIEVWHSRRQINYEMENTNTVADVKKRLQEEVNYHPSELVLVYGGVELKDSCLLHYCCVACENNTLLLVLPMNVTGVCQASVLVNIYVVSSKETIQLRLLISDTIRNAKLKIQQKLSIAFSEQKLIYAGQELLNDYTLMSYNIHSCSTLQLLESGSNYGSLKLDKSHSHEPPSVPYAYDSPDTPPEKVLFPSTIRILFRLHPELLQYIDFDTLLPYLNKYEILTPPERQFLINERNSHAKKVNMLLDFLEKKNEETVDEFVRALNDEPHHKGHKTLYRLIKN